RPMSARTGYLLQAAPPAHRAGLVLTLVIAAVALVLSLGAADARAVVTTPVPVDVAPVPPRFRRCPGRGYGGAWQTGSAWWEDQCSYVPRRRAGRVRRGLDSSL